MFSLICVRINGRVNNREVGDLRRHRGHYDVMVMFLKKENTFENVVHFVPPAISHLVNATLYLKLCS